MELNSFAHTRGDLNCVSKVIRDCFGFYFALGLVHFLNQSYAKLNNHDLVDCVFRALGCLVVSVVVFFLL